MRIVPGAMGRSARAICKFPFAGCVRRAMIGLVKEAIGKEVGNPMTEAIYKRASVRRFTDDPVTDDEVRALLRAAMAAPSAGNQQPWEFYVVRDEAMRVRLSETTPYAKPAAAAPCVIVACAHMPELRFPLCVPQDISAAVENLLLEAVEQGLGAVWLGVAPEPDRVAAVAEVLDLPEGIEPFALVACGRPAEEPTPRGRDRYDESRIHWVS